MTMPRNDLPVGDMWDNALISDTLTKMAEKYTPEQKKCNHRCIREGEGHIGFCVCLYCKAVGKFEE